MLAGQADTQDLVAGSCTAAVGVGIGYLVAQQGRALPRLHWADLAHLARLPYEVVAETWQVFGAVVRGLREREMPTGSWSTVKVDIRTDPGGEGGGWRAARRVAVVTALMSVTPNAFAVRVDPQEGTALVHRLTGGKGDPPRPPGDRSGGPAGDGSEGAGGGLGEAR
ncbi:MAG: hypothetical protein ACRDX8_06590 [Acidimicrobiales bacterium]